MNRLWHAQHKMPDRATLEQRLHWRLEHAQHCDCRPIPAPLREQMRQRGIAPPKPAALHAAR
jgi:hypothetical protein